jgi:DedD protein
VASAPPESPKAAATPAVAAPAKAPVTEAKAKAKTPPPVDSEAAPPKQPAAEAAPKTKPETKADPKAKTAGNDSGSFVVQVAALTDADKAKQMREQIAAAGVKAYTEVVPTAKGNVTRVRAGPFASRADADKARDKLKALGLNGNVVPK